MPNYHVTPAQALQGSIRVPGDKSITHRALMLGAIAEGRSTIFNPLMGDDNLATLNALRALGVVIDTSSSNEIIVDGVGLKNLSAPKQALDLGNSGTGLRLLAGLLAGSHFSAELTGDASLRRRPMQRIIDPLLKMGADITASAEGTPPLKIIGNQHLKAIEYELPVASAQVKSAILLAGLSAEGVTRVIEPAITRDHSERMLKNFGVELSVHERCVEMRGQQSLQATDIHVPGDLSSAAFFIVGATITPGSDITIHDVGMNPTRRGVITILQAMGADITLLNDRHFESEPVADIRVRYSKLNGIDIPREQISLAIDELPILFIAAATAKGQTRVVGAEELRYKESDRLAAMAEGLQRLGCSVELLADGLIIEGNTLQGGDVDSHDDHRIAMAFAIAANVASDVIRVRDCANVATSFPTFVDTANQLGMQINVEHA